MNRLVQQINLNFLIAVSLEDDDDDNNVYDYGNFSSYNNFQSKPDNKPLEIKKQEITMNIDNEVQKEIFLKYENKETEHNNASHHVFGTNDINENKLKCDEDLSIEDLNLKVDEDLKSIVESNTEQIEISEPSVGSEKDLDIPNNSINDNPNCDNSNVPPLDETTVDAPEPLKEFSLPFVEQLEAQPNEEVLMKNEFSATNAEKTVEENTPSIPNEVDEPFVLEESSITSENNTQSVDQSTKDFKSNLDDNFLDDDFGDFDDFQSVNTISNVTNIVETSINPWENVDTNESDFRNFTANFEETKIQSTEDLTPTESVSITNNLDLPESETKATDNNIDDDDDFGDFDDFQSSSAKTESNEVSIEDPVHCQELPVFNLQSAESDHQIMERITKVLSSVFLEELAEPESGFEGKLESLLSETWGHLMETDERQPYIVNWNNSLGQKTLLRALCIDSRNIVSYCHLYK